MNYTGKMLFTLFYAYKSGLHRLKNSFRVRKIWNIFIFVKFVLYGKWHELYGEKCFFRLFYKYKSGLHRLKNSFQVRKISNIFIFVKFVLHGKWHELYGEERFSRCFIHIKVVCCIAWKINFESEKFRIFSFSQNLFYTENKMSYTRKKCFSRCFIHIKVVCIAWKIHFEWKKFR